MKKKKSSRADLIFNIINYTVFGIFTDREAAFRAGREIRAGGLARQIYTVRPFHVDGRDRR